MIDKNKIKSAARKYCKATYGTVDDNPFIAEAFRKGAKWVLDWTSDLGDFCNNHSSNHYAYNIYLIMCKLIGWL